MSFSLPSARARHAHEVVALAVGRGALAKREPRGVVAIRHKVLALPVSRVRSPEGHASAGENVPKPWVGSRRCSLRDSVPEAGARPARGRCISRYGVLPIRPGQSRYAPTRLFLSKGHRNDAGEISRLAG